MTRWSIIETKLLYNLCGKKNEVIQDEVIVELGDQNICIDFENRNSSEKIGDLMKQEEMKDVLEDIFYLYDLFKEHDFLRRYACITIPYFEENLYEDNIGEFEKVIACIVDKCREGSYAWGETAHLCLHIACIKIIAAMNGYSRMWKKPLRYSPIDLLTMIEMIERNVNKYVHDEIAIVKVKILWKDLEQLDKAYDSCFTIRNDYLSEYGRAYVFQYGYTNYEKALARYQHCIRLKEYFKAYCHMGDCYIKLKDWQKACECFQTGVKIMEKDMRKEPMEFEDLMLAYYHSFSAGNILMNRIVNLPKAFQMFQKAVNISIDLLEYPFYAKCEEDEAMKIKKTLDEKIMLEALYKNLYLLSRKLGYKKREEEYYNFWNEYRTS